MTEMPVEFKFTVPVGGIPADHQKEAERQAREAFILALLRQGDISAGRAAELLEIDRWQLSECMTAYGISPFDETLTCEQLEREMSGL